MGLFDNRERMWFGTEQRMGWIETPQTGADVSSAGMVAESTLLGGGAHVRNSWDSHKTYTFSWGDSTTLDMVSLLQGYRNGSYGRGLLYFHDPMYYGTNLLPKRWADPSMAVNFEAEPIIPENWPTSVPVNSSENNYPVTAARYTLPANYSSQADNAEHFMPIPPNMTLMVGAVYSGPGQLYVRTPAGITVLPGMGLSDANVVNVTISGQPWARLGVRNTTASPTQITITGASARISEVVVSGGETSVNRFTNPSFEAAGPAVEIRRNLMPNPLPANATDFNVSGTPTILPEGGLNSQAVTAQTAYIFSAPTASGATAGRVYAFRAQIKGDAGTAVSSILPRPHKRVGNTYYTPDSGIVSYPSNGQWQDVAFFWTATESVAPADMFEFSLISNGTAPIGFNMAIRNMLIEDVGTAKPPTVPPFFTGSQRPRVRQNLAVNPRGLNTVGWSSNLAAQYPVTRGVTPPIPHPLGIQTAIMQSSPGVGPQLVELFNVDGLGSTGPRRMLGVWVLVTEPGYSAYGVDLPANQWTFVRHNAGFEAGAFAFFYARKTSGNASTTVRAYLTGAVVEEGTAPVGDFFDGDLPAPRGFVNVWDGVANSSGSSRYDEDFTAAWTAAVNGSPSILTGIGVPGVTAINCYAIRSSRWSSAGSYSMRLIPSGASNASRAQFYTFAPESRVKGTALGTVRLEAPLAGTLNASARGLRVQNPVMESAKAPNAAGVTALSLPYDGVTDAAPLIQFWHGGSVDSGDVWWDSAGLFEPDYTNPWFDGSSAGASWTGTPNASTSTMLQPIRSAIALGPWRSGEGHSGVAFVGNPTVINYNGVNGGQLGLSCVLREVGAWA